MGVGGRRSVAVTRRRAEGSKVRMDGGGRRAVGVRGTQGVLFVGCGGGEEEGAIRKTMSRASAAREDCITEAVRVRCVGATGMKRETASAAAAAAAMVSERRRVGNRSMPLLAE